MAEFKFSNDFIMEQAINFALLEVTVFLEQKIRENTPRDKNRLPDNINRKDGLAPIRKGRNPVIIGGNWYEGVTGNLKRSIGHEKLGDMIYQLGVKKGPATEYARAQEYGYAHIPERSFVRKGIEDNLEQAKNIFEKALKQYLKI
ncbi:hypothetical protein GW846_03175 [Candidatus Gracilibacteria bacterium]|nr:hypothetical protein [Candidatus Gracilibacteria bacterium]